MSDEVRFITSVTYTADPLLIGPRPSVICTKSAFGREIGMSTRVLDAANRCFIDSSGSAFTPLLLVQGSCPQRLPGRSRSSSFDIQDLQQRPVVLSGRPYHLTSYLLDPRDSAQRHQEMNQIPVFFPGCPRSGNLQCIRECRSILEDDFRGYCCQEDRRRSNEDYEITTEREKHVTMPSSCPEQTIIQKPSLPGQRFGAGPNNHGQLPEGGVFEHCEVLGLSPQSETRKSHDLKGHEEVEKENDDEKEREEHEEQLKEFRYHEVEPRDGKCSTVSRDEEYRSESVLLSSVDHRGDGIKMNGAFQSNGRHTGRKHGPACCRASTSILPPLGRMYSNTGYAKKRAKRMTTNWTQNHLGGATCLVCFKTLKRSHYMKAHMFIHTGEKPYKCAYCDKSFNQIGNRNAHQRIHTGEKPYACEYCGKRFVFISSKRNHTRVHCQSSSLHFQKR